MPHADVTDRLQELFQELEQGWLERRDDCLVDHLAAEYPEFAEDLYLFFADLVEAELVLDTPRPDLAALDAIIRERLKAEAPLRSMQRIQTTQASPSTPGQPGTSPALASPGANLRALRIGGPAPRPLPFGTLLRECTQLPQAEIAGALDLTPDFLVTASEHANVLSGRARDELITRAICAFALSSDSFICELRESLHGPAADFQRAASRKVPYHRRQKTFAELVKQSGLSAEQKGFWLSLK